MTDRKNVSLAEPYASMYEDLKARGEFNRAHGGFSQFVQDKIEEFHENPQRVRAEHHKKEEERHRKMKKALADRAGGLESSSESPEVDEKEFFSNFLERIKKRKDSPEWYSNPAKVYRDLEDGWIRRYSKKFTSIKESEFREKFLETIGEDKIKEELDLQVAEI